MTEERPWGSYTVLHDPEDCKVKRISVKPSERLSYQYHHKREEIWVFISGKGTVTLNDNLVFVKAGSIVHIPIGAKHRIENTGEENLDFVEVQLGTYFGEDDIVRLKDDYDRL